jgi:uncharacterized protein YbjT (DUF2867 family)
MTAKILAMTGATGFVGRATLELALAAGWQVRALTRRPQPARPEVTWVSGSLEQKDALARLVEGSTAVLHIAGVVSAPTREGFVSGNITATQNMLDVATAEGISRFVHVSSLSAREPKLSIYGWSKAEGENLVTASDRAWTVVRPPAVFGPRDTEMLDLFRMAQRGLQLAPKGRMSAIYVEDLARLLVALIGDESGTSQRAIYEPDDGREHGWAHKEFGQAIAAALGRKRVFTLPVPENLLHAAAMLDVRFRGTKAKLTPDRANYIAHPDWVVSQNARPPAVIWSPNTPTQRALEQTVRWYRAEKWL